MLRMDEINKIRKTYKLGETKNAIAVKFNRSWETVDRIVSLPLEELEIRGQRRKRKSTVITPEVIEGVNGYLREEIEKKVKRKQRYTVKKIFDCLKERGIYSGSIKGMEKLVKKQRKDLGIAKNKTYLPLSFSLGSSLQVDHGEVDIIINGERSLAYLFVASVPGEVLRYCQVFPIKSSEAWGEFHERAFEFFGGIFPQVVYDNDSVLVKKVIGVERKQTSFSHSLEDHYGFESRFCNPASGNEKGSVENGVGYCRRNFFHGLPDFSSWDESNKYLEMSSLQDISNRTHYKTGEKLSLTYDKLKTLLSPLVLRKAWRKWASSRVDTCQLVTVDNHDYSVPEKYVGSNVRVSLTIFKIQIYDKENLIAEHKREYEAKDSLILDHYLDQLQYKPSALWDCKAVKDHQFDERLMRVWSRLFDKHPSREANRLFVQVLILGRKYSKESFLKGVEKALSLGAIDASSVENIIRQSEMPKQNFDSEKLKNLLKLPPTSWEFDVAIYRELCEVAQ